MMSAPRNVASQPLHARDSLRATTASELEIDDLIGVSVAQFDQQRNRDKPERRGCNRAWPLVNPHHDVLARGQRESDKSRDDDRRCDLQKIEVRRNRKALIDVPCGCERARSENLRS